MNLLIIISIILINFFIILAYFFKVFLKQILMDYWGLNHGSVQIFKKRRSYTFRE